LDCASARFRTGAATSCFSFRPDHHVQGMLKVDDDLADRATRTMATVEPLVNQG
jgi:hypothetical protein